MLPNRVRSISVCTGCTGVPRISNRRVPGTNWGIRQMKTRWGTCNIDARRIWLNLELIKKPPLCLEYIVVHELVHLLERRHNDRFTAHMNQFMPQWQLYRDELNHAPLAHEVWEY